MRATTVGFLGSFAILAGCAGRSGQATRAHDPGDWGGSGAKTTASAPPFPAARPSPAAESASPPRSTEASAEAPSAGAQWFGPAPAPRDRPGLGTEWGETRESHIREVSFFRAEPEQPFALSQLFYNDRQGVEAMASYHRGAPHFHDVPTANGAITVSLRDAWGEPLEALRVSDRIYVVGQEGERYSIILSNRTSRRFEAVATVDGLDVISGKTGSYANRGYVLLPWASLEIDGFRQTEDEVAAFRFSKVRDSYAAQRGESRNVGVIGIAFFEERGADWNADELRRRDTANPFPNDGRFAH
jgi:hypothetical protein